MIQAAVIGQTFGLLSGVKHDFRLISSIALTGCSLLE